MFEDMLYNIGARENNRDNQLRYRVFEDMLYNVGARENIMDNLVRYEEIIR